MKIREVKIKKDKKNDITKSGYFNVFGDKAIAELCRKIQSISSRWRTTSFPEKRLHEFVYREGTSDIIELIKKIY